LIKDEYKKNYDNKQEQWNEEDVQQGNMERLEKEKKKETKLFLNQIKRRPRFAQIFVDQYSLRDENVNKNIIEINKHLGRNLYEKKNMNLKIDKYLDVIDNDNKINDEDELEEENSFEKENLFLQQMMLKKLEFEEESDNIYDKLGIKEKEQILKLVNKGRIEKNKEEIYKENFEMFQNFKQHVIKKEKIIKEMSKTQYKNPYTNKEDFLNKQNLNINNLNEININSKLNNEILHTYNTIYEDNRKINEENNKIELQDKFASILNKTHKSSKKQSKNNLMNESNISNMTSNKNFNLPPIDYHNSSNNSKRSSKKSSNKNKNYEIESPLESKNLIFY
jgi:hypothetical protein